VLRVQASSSVLSEGPEISSYEEIGPREKLHFFLKLEIEALGIGNENKLRALGQAW